MSAPYPPEFFAQAQDACWSIFVAPDEVPTKAATLVSDWPERFASHQLAGILALALGDAPTAQAELARAEARAAPEERAFVFDRAALAGRESVAAALEAQGPGIWTVESLYDILPGGPLKFHQVMRVVRLESGALVLVNPIALDDEVKGLLDSLGPVGFIVSQSAYHYMFIAPTRAAYPEARLIGPESHRAKAETQALGHDGFLADEAPFAPGEIAQIHLDGHAFDETALYHPKSRSLLLTDMVLSGKDPKTRFIDFYCWLWGQHRAFGCLAYHRFLTQDKAALGAALDRVGAWDFTQILGGHGPAERGDARAALSCAWAEILDSI